MIHIEENQNIEENPHLKVVTPTGDYEDTALIEFYDVATPSIVVGAFQAQYVKYGSMVYRFNDHIELGKAILEIDPNSTHTSASYVRMTNELLSKMNNGTLEPESLDRALSTEQDKMEEQIENPPVEEEVSEEVPSEGEIETGEATDDSENTVTPVEEIIPADAPTDQTEQSEIPTSGEVDQASVPEVIPETILETEPVALSKRKYKRKIG